MRTMIRGLLLVLLLAAMATGALWLFRKPLAEVYLTRWCRDRELACEADITRLDPGGLEMRALAVTSAEGAPLAARQVRIGWRWARLAGPALHKVTLDGPDLAAAFDGEALSLLGLERAIPDRTGGDAALPALHIKGGTLSLTTPAGAVTAAIDATLDDTGSGGLDIAVEPVALRRGQDHIRVEVARLHLALDAGDLTGEGELTVPDARLGNLAVETLAASLSIEDGPDDAARRMRWSAGAARIVAAAGGVEALSVDGLVAIDRFDPLNPAALPGSLREAQVSLKAERGALADVSARAIGADLALDWQEGGVAGRLAGRLAGPVSLEARSVSAPAGRADSLSFTGELALEGLRDQVLQGALVLEAAALAEAHRDRLLERLPELPGLPGHRDALAAALDAALGDLQAGLQGRIERRPRGLVASAREPMRLSSASGADILLQPAGDTPWLTVSNGDVVLGGKLAMSGGGLPQLTLDLERAALGPGGLDMRAENIRLRDWTVRARTIGAELDRLELLVSETAAGGAATRIEVNGGLSMAGRFGGSELRPTDLFGAASAVQAEGSWRIDTPGNTCLGLASEGLVRPGLSLGAFATKVCPSGEPIELAGRDGKATPFFYQAVSLPYTIGTGGGMLRLGSGEVSWRASPGFEVSLSAATFEQDYAAAGSDLRLSGQDARIDLALGTGPPELHAVLGPTRLRGSRLPAALSAGGLDLAITGTGAALTGSGHLHAVEITAPGDDPVFEPLLTSQALRISGSTLALEGPVRLASGGELIAHSSLFLSFPGLSGTATLHTPTLVFRPGGLQPTDLSERFRGLLTDARGAARADAEIRIERGRPTVSARVALDALGFQTVALGRVRGVNGTVAFDDFLALSTPPGQSVRIASIDPGITLENGTLTFQLDGAQTIRVEQASWPFAGGQLVMSDEAWTVGGLENRLEVDAEAITLDGLVEALRLPDVTASGVVSGRVPLMFTGTDAIIAGARLQAAAPGGTLRYTGEAGRQAGQVNETAALAFDALRDFRFEVLEIVTNGRLSGDLAVDIRLLGHNPDVLSGAPFAFNLAIEAPFIPLLKSGASLKGTGWLAEAVVQEDARGDE